jgi:hypothetical protein
MSEQLTVTNQSPAMTAIMLAVVNPDVDAGKVRELVAIQAQMQEAEARKAYASALVSFQTRVPVIKKGDTANGKAYARLDRIWREVRPLMDECGLAVSWQSAKYDKADALCTLDGMLMHRDGHSEPIHYSMPIPEQIRGQNAAQVMGSATTYAKRYATCNVLGIQVGDDDDGYKVGKPSGMTPISTERIAELRELVEASGADIQGMLIWAGVDRIEDFPAAVYDKATANLRSRIVDDLVEAE